jgi:5'-deoxynucleotidase YfbR-like HD superfamily hydrolase
VNLLEKVLHTRSGGAVQRAHTIRHIGQYSVAEHSWGVAMLLWHLFPKAAGRLVFSALTHDVPETLTGDVPSTAKQHDELSDNLDDAICKEFGLPVPGHLGELDRRILKCCDRLECYLWALEQLAMGNAFAREVIYNLEATLEAEGGLEPEAKTFYSYLKSNGCIADRVGLLQRIRKTLT